ncbi:MAG: hypothetical protein ACFFF9_12885 [Candidatus Thorarchaeota archaeon]
MRVFRIRKFNDLVTSLMIISMFIVISGSAFLILQMQPGLPTYDALPPSNAIPSEESTWENFGNLSISASISCDVMDTHRTDRFEVELYLNVNNTGPTDVQDFHPVKLSIFREDHFHYFTFGLLPSTNTTLHGFSNVTIYYGGDRTLNTIEDITPTQGSIRAYGRVLITFGDQQAIVTTSLFVDYFPIE